jgi:hypothetical protein
MRNWRTLIRFELRIYSLSVFSCVKSDLSLITPRIQPTRYRDFFLLKQIFESVWIIVIFI